MQITKVVDSYDGGQDPFKGDGYIAKGRVLSKLLGKQPDVTREIVIEQFLKAMKAYRSTHLAMPSAAMVIACVSFSHIMPYSV